MSQQDHHPAQQEDLHLEPGLQAKIRPLQGLEKDMRNPFGKLNIGLIEIEILPSGEKPSFRIVFYGHKKGKPVLRFDSGRL